MDDSDKMERVCSYLRMIERTRLMRNTTEELERLVGFSVGSGNGLARKGGKSLFMKDAIFRELAHIAKQQTDLDLQEVLVRISVPTASASEWEMWLTLHRSASISSGISIQTQRLPMILHL